MLESIRKVFGLLRKHERRQLVMLFIAVLIMSGIELVGIASIMPFLTVASNPETIETNRYLAWAYQTFDFQSRESFLFALGLGVVAVVVVGNAFSATTFWYLLRFGWNQVHQLSSRLLERFLRQPYEFFLNRNSAELSTSILAEVDQLVKGLIRPGIDLFARGILAVCILAFLVWVDPVLALTAFLVLGGAYFLFFAAVKRPLSRLGRERVEANKARYKIAGEALGGIKDVKVLGREAMFVQNYSAQAQRYASNQAARHIIERLPRYGLDIIAFGGLMLITLYLMRAGDGFQSAIPIIGLYAFAGYRLLPALQRIYAAVSNIRFNHPVLDLIYRDLVLDGGIADSHIWDGEQTSRLRLGDSIVLNDVSYRYPEAAGLALKNIEMEIGAKTRVGLVGETGSGKTTLVDMLLGLLEPTEGTLAVDGETLTLENRRRWQRNVGYVPQDIFLSDDTIRKNIAFGVPDEEIDDEQVRRVAEIANIATFIETELEEGFETFVGERGVRLSGGQKQRIGIARALYSDPEVLIFDEATSALDNVTEAFIIEAIDSLASNKTIITIAHRLSTVRDFDDIYVLDHGRVVANGTYDELLDHNDQFRQMAEAAS